MWLEMARQFVLLMCVAVAVSTGCEYEDAQWDGDEAEFFEDEEVEFRPGLGTTRRLNTTDLDKPLYQPSAMKGQSLTNCMGNVTVSNNGVISPSWCRAPYVHAQNATSWEIKNNPDEVFFSFQKSYINEHGTQHYGDIRVIPMKNGKLWWEDEASYCTGGNTLVLGKGISISSNGSVISNPGKLFAACTDSAPGKAALWGYPPSKNRTEFEATIRVIRADYCGNGISYTQEGKVIDFVDHNFTASSNRPLEAIWDHHGAICVEHPRLGGNAPGCVPSCSQLGGLSEVVSKNSVFAVTRL